MKKSSLYSIGNGLRAVSMGLAVLFFIYIALTAGLGLIYLAWMLPVVLIPLIAGQTMIWISGEKDVTVKAKNPKERIYSIIGLSLIGAAALCVAVLAFIVNSRQ